MSPSHGRHECSEAERAEEYETETSHRYGVKRGPEGPDGTACS
jgi:hypothetical protein